MLKNKMEAQIATILTLIMAVIFLFIVITINIGNIAQEKTMVSNASDGAALLLASMLGSLANALKIKLGLWGNLVENCKVNWDLLFSIIILIAAIALTVASLGAGTPAIVLAAINLALTITMFGLGMYNALSAEPGVFKKFELKFQNMTLEQRMKEKAIQYALFALITDPNKICTNGVGDPKELGGCIDREDLDMDGDTTDCIHYFSKWYNDRLTALPRVGDIVQTLYEKIFSKDIAGQKAPRFYVWEDQETWKPKKEPKPSEFIHQGFWIDTNNNDQVDAKAGSSLIPEQGDLRSLDISSNDTHNPQGIIYSHDIYFTDWLEEKFIPLVEELYRYGYGIYRDKGVNTAVKEIKDLVEDIKDFQKELGQIYGTTFESRIESFDEWIVFFYDPNKDDEWFDRMLNWIKQVNSWIGILDNRTDEINRDLVRCEAPGPWVCGPAGTECCESVCHACPPPEDDDDEIIGSSDYREGGGEGSGAAEAALFHDSNVKARFGWFPASEEKILLAQGEECCPCECVRWCGCNPAGMDGGRLCPSSHCKPTLMLNTPTGAARWCCESVYNLHYQGCDAQQHYGGGGGGCGDSPCYDTYHNCAVDHALNHITWQHALNYLQQFLDDVTTIRNAFGYAYINKKSKENDPRAYEALYEWDDRVAKGEVGEQLVHHMVYVKLDKDSFKSYTTMPIIHTDVPDREYAIPHVHNKRELLVGKCAEVASSKGSFNITVGRYDQDIGKGSPLKNLWIFKSRRSPSKAEEGKFLSGTTDADAPPSSYAEKAKFVLDNGIVSQTEGHYGPGHVYTKAELEAWGTEAEKRNKDIYIKRLK